MRAFALALFSGAALRVRPWYKRNMSESVGKPGQRCIWPFPTRNSAHSHHLMSPRQIPVCSAAHPPVKTCPASGPIGDAAAWTGSDVPASVKCTVSPQILSTTSSSVGVGRVHQPPRSDVDVFGCKRTKLTRVLQTLSVSKCDHFHSSLLQRFTTVVGSPKADDHRPPFMWPSHHHQHSVKDLQTQSI